jgi:hypothetical protein
VASSKLEEQAIAAYVDRAAAIVGLPIAAAHRSEVIGATLAEVPTVQA